MTAQPAVPATRCDHTHRTEPEFARSACRLRLPRNGPSPDNQREPYRVLPEATRRRGGTSDTYHRQDCERCPPQIPASRAADAGPRGCFGTPVLAADWVARVAADQLAGRVRRRLRSGWGRKPGLSRKLSGNRELGSPWSRTRWTGSFLSSLSTVRGTGQTLKTSAQPKESAIRPTLTDQLSGHKSDRRKDRVG